MKTVALSLALGLVALSPVHAQTSGQAMPPAAPPPGMNDPGVKVAPANKPTTPVTTTQTPSTHAKSGKGATINDKLPTLPASPSAPSTAATPATTDANGSNAPTVSVRTEGDETIQEYRRSGVLYMVVVTPKSGIPQTYLVDANGKWQKSGPQDPVKPVMYKVLEWGKSPPATEAAESGK